MNETNALNLTGGDEERPTGPASTFTHPDEVLRGGTLSIAEKRAILSAWVSDAHTVPNRPASRQLDSGAIVDVDTLLEALRGLDGQETAGPARARGLWQRRRSPEPRWLRPLRRRRDDDDDDPPPSPATALPPGIELELRRRRDADWVPAAA